VSPSWLLCLVVQREVFFEYAAPLFSRSFPSPCAFFPRILATPVFSPLSHDALRGFNLRDTLQHVARWRGVRSHLVLSLLEFSTLVGSSRFGQRLCPSSEIIRTQCFPEEGLGLYRRLCLIRGPFFFCRHSSVPIRQAGLPKTVSVDSVSFP